MNITPSEAKLIAFLTDMSRTENVKIEGKLPDGNGKQLRKGSLAGYTKNVGSLQATQVAVLNNKNSSACGTLLK